MAFPFLSLPLEIRRPIYRYALPYSVDESGTLNVDHATTAVRPHSVNRRSRHIRNAEECPIHWYRGISPSIIFANRQIYEEACEILYHENVFLIYVKHPRQPRLPMNESRADDDSFAHIAWKHRSWSHPINHKIPLEILRNHRHLSQVCRLHIQLPDMRDLFAADMYMRTTSYASYHGLGAWVEKLVATGGELSEEERKRMNYIKQIKKPIDEVAEVLRMLPRIDELVIVFKSESHEVAFIEYVASGLLHLRRIKRAHCLYRPAEGMRFGATHLAKLRDDMMAPRMRELEREIESDSMSNPRQPVVGLSPEALEMLEMLEAMRNRMLLIRELRSEFKDSNVDQALPILTVFKGDL